MTADDLRAQLAALADEIENPRAQRPGMQRRRNWADRIRRALLATGPASETARQSSGWTRHGHPIEGMVQVGCPQTVARCGGPSLCFVCAGDVRTARTTPTPTPPTTVQADRDAGQVRLTVMHAPESGYDVSICSCDAGPYIGARKSGTPCCCEVCGFMTREQHDALAARQSADTEADVRVEWGVRLTQPDGHSDLDIGGRGPAQRVVDQCPSLRTLVRRTVTTSAWEEA